MPAFSLDAISKRQKKIREKLKEIDALVIISSGSPITKPGGLDQTYPFLPHPEYYWISGSRRASSYMAYSHKDGWIHFVKKIDAAEKLWEGNPEIPEGEDVLKFRDWLDERKDMPIVFLGSADDELRRVIKIDSSFQFKVQEIFDQVRRQKDIEEINLIKKAVLASEKALLKVKEFLRPGVCERDIQIELEMAMLKAGAYNTSFSTIVGVGTNSSVLHFAPGSKIAQKGDLVLIDSGAEIYEYASDVTRTFCVSDNFNQKQQAVYDIVLNAQKKAIEKCQVAVEWHDVHREAATSIANGLIDLKLIRGDVNNLLESGVVSLFFPHGVGHMLGLRVRDVGGRASGREEGRMVCGSRVRVDLPLEENFVMTVEPGVYFVDAILKDKARRNKFKDEVNWQEVDKWMDVGGVRIEDDILITKDGPLNLTSNIPK